jgi:hypothetical protein
MIIKLYYFQVIIRLFSSNIRLLNGMIKTNGILNVYNCKNGKLLIMALASGRYIEWIYNMCN